MSRNRMVVVREWGSCPSFRLGLGLMILVLLMVEGVVQAQPRFFQFQGGPSSPEAVVSLVASDPAGISLKVSVVGLLSDRIFSQGGEFGSLEIPGEGISAQVGKPRLPVIRRLVEIPFGATLAVQVDSASILDRSLKDLALDGRIVPVQPPVPKIPGAAERVPFVIDGEHYKTDAFWPSELVKVREIGVLRQTRLALLEIFPVRYNPRRGLVRLCPSAQFRVSFQGADSAQTRARQKRYAGSFSHGLDPRLFIKTDLEPAWLEGWSTQPVGYLMVADDALYEAVLPLADWKRHQGFQVNLVRTSLAGSNKDEIKEYIQNAYETWEIPPTFLLLVGDVGQVPTYQVGGVTTDLYYTTMDEEDYFPDIQVGRLAAPDSLSLASVVEKIVGYEKGLWDLEDGWTRRGYFMASNDLSWHRLAEGTQEYAMRLARAYGMICDSLYAYYSTGTPVSVALNDGRSIAVYSGHGNYYGWAGPDFNQNDVMALQNGQMYPLVCSHACMTGDYSKAICFGETWLRVKNKGAVAFWGATVSSYWDEDDLLQRRMFDALFDSSITWLSGMMDRAKLGLYLHYGGEGLSKEYFEMYNLLGDPSMHLWTKPPKTLVASHPEEVPLGASSFIISVRQPRASGPDSQGMMKSTVFVPVNDALASISMNEELYGTALTTHGVVSVKLDPPLAVKGSLDVAVSKTGYRPYLGSSEVCAYGPYLLYQSHLLDDSADGNGDGQANPGETIQLAVTLKNVGNEEARQVTALLATRDPYVLIEGTSANFGNIPEEDFSVGQPSYEGHISKLCPGDRQITFTLTAVDSLGHCWIIDFQIPVVTPAMLCHGYQIQDDPPGGNGNGVAEAGENLGLVAALRNDGGGGAVGVTATLTSADPHIQVLSDSSVFGDLAPGLQASGSPPYQIAIGETSTDLLSCPLMLNIAAEGGYTSTDTLVLLVGTPGFSDDMETEGGNWTHQAIGEGYGDHWHLSVEKSHSGSHSWKSGDTGDGTYFHLENGALVSPAILLANNSMLTFWHWMEAEIRSAMRAWDGGVVEVSADGGSTWEQIDPVGGYPFTIWDEAPGVGSPFEAGTPCFSGSHDWKQEQFDLSAYSNLVQLRLRFGSDEWSEKEGWYIDDVQVAAPQASSTLVSDIQILVSNRQILLRWAPCAWHRDPIQYEVYRSCQPEEVVRAENRVAVVSENRYVDDLKGLSRAEEDLFYAVVAIDAAGRRFPPSQVVGRWKRPLEPQPVER